MRGMSGCLALALLLGLVGAAAADPADELARQKYRRVEEKAESIEPQLRSLPASRRERLFTRTATHPVSRLDRLPAYDPDGLIGFCFGRAMTAHLVARRMGLHPDALRKLFIVGDLRQRGAAATEWRFHVTTLVQGSDSLWYAVDPILGRVHTMEQWIDTVQATWDIGHRAYLYLTPPSIVLPDVSRVPDSDQETGEALIELSFDPAGKEGFTHRPQVDARAYELSEEASRRYLVDVEESSDAFDFARATINGQDFPYNDYFVDLLTDLAGRPDDWFVGAQGGSPSREAALSTRARRLASPDFGRLLDRGP